MTAYYNEIDPFAASWLRELIKRNLIAPGEVDERSIEEAKPDDLKPFTQHHFFAGIGVWSYALRRAGWEDSRPVWTMSCPCQPFSSAGAKKGLADERHLWPAAFQLVAQCRPPVVFGEQVAGKNAEPWIELVQTDLEAVDYAFGCVPFPSAGVGAPHIRDRAFWVANTDSPRSPTGLPASARGHEGFAGVIDHGSGKRIGTWRRSADTGHGDVGLAYSDNGRKHSLLRPEENHSAENSRRGAACQPLGQLARRDESKPEGVQESFEQPTGPTNGFWRDADWLFCRDGKWRPVEPGTFPLVDGSPTRVGRLRGYGNAINAEAAKVFIEAATEALNQTLPKP